MSNCLRCGNPYEPGDRFCQDCGAVLGEAVTPVPYSSSPSDWRARLPQLPQLRMDRVPAEVILIAAALAYMASAAFWSNQSALRKAFSQLKMPAITLTTIKLPMPAKSADVLPATTAPSAAAAAHSAAPPVVANHRPVDSPAKQPTGNPPQNAAHTTDQPAASWQQTVTRSDSADRDHQLQPSAKVSRTDRMAQAVTAEPRRARRDSAVEQEDAFPAAEQKSAPAWQEVKEDLAEYNRLLAAYFESAANSSQARPEPPSYSEWVSAGKPQF